jgi:hypothetical protein
MSDKDAASRYGYNNPQTPSDLPVSAPLTTQVPALPREWAAPETFGLPKGYPVGPPQNMGETKE